MKTESERRRDVERELEWGGYDAAKLMQALLATRAHAVRASRAT